MREHWIRVREDTRLDIGSHIIVNEEDVPLGGGDGYTATIMPYMAEIIEWGAHWSEPGRSGYYALTRELPDGERLAREHYARLEIEG